LESANEEISKWAFLFSLLVPSRLAGTQRVAIASALPGFTTPRARQKSGDLP